MISTDARFRLSLFLFTGVDDTVAPEVEGYFRTEVCDEPIFPSR